MKPVKPLQKPKVTNRIQISSRAKSLSHGGNQKEKLISPWKYQQKFKNAVLILQYIGVKYLLPEYDIDSRLIDHFKTFKFRDN